MAAKSSRAASLTGLLLSAGACLHALRASAGPAVAAVLSSQAAPYEEALDGARREIGPSLPSFALSRGEPALPPSVRVVVACGAKAASRGYGGQIAPVYALTSRPGINPQAAVVQMDPDPAVLAERLRRLAPGVKTLGVFWISPGFGGYFERLRAAAAPRGLAVVAASPEDSSDIPDELRRLYGKIDALWLPSDPLLLNEEVFPVFLVFSRSNGVPLFVSNAGLAGMGATASIGASFREMGRLAGIAAREALGGKPQERRIYATNVEVTINRTAAAKVGLPLSKEALDWATRVITE